MVKFKINRPSIPILFLDTNFFIDLARGRKGEKTPHFAKQLELIDLVRGLTKNKKLLCPQGDQDNEYDLNGKNTEEIREEQTRLSLGVHTTYHYGTEMWQLQIAVKAYVEGKDTVEYGQDSIFSRDPLKQLHEALSQRFIVSAHLPLSPQMHNEQRRVKGVLAQEYEKLRQEKKLTPAQFDVALRQEIAAPLYLLQKTLGSAIPKLAANQPITADEQEGILTFGEYMAYLSRYTGRDVSFVELAQFLGSPHYATIPYVRVRSKLFASMLTQQHAVKESDNHDFSQASQMLPFASYFLTDSPFKHRLITKPLNLDTEYGVKIYSMKEMGQLISELAPLAK